MSAFATNDNTEISPAEWEEFLENINFDKKIHKILAMDTDEGKKSYLVWWSGRDIEDSTWIPIPHFIKKYGPEAEKEIIGFKDKQAAIAREKNSPDLFPEWSSLPYARTEKSKVYQRQYEDFDREHEAESYPMVDMPKLSDREHQSLIRFVGNYTWGGRRSRKKKRTRRRKRKTKRKRKKKKRKRKRTKKMRRRR